MAKISLALFLVGLVGLTLSAPTASKVGAPLLKTLETKTRANIFITMKAGTTAVLDAVDQGIYSARADRVQAVYNALNAHAAVSQKNVLELLSSPLFFAIKVQSFWISNQVYVQGADRYLIETVAALDEVASVEEELIVYLDEPSVADVEPIGVMAEWGVTKIRAEDAWAAGANGNTAVVGVIDTGARHTHEAIRDNYRGDTRSWFNPYSGTAQPGDGHGHGTHCTGTIAGKLGLGVAPNAQWISCKGLNDQGSGTQAGLTACGQFMTCPHLASGGSPDCSLAPDAVSNSWGGGSQQTWFDASIRAWNSALIIPVFALGNSGPSCTTSNSPGDSTAGVISVGATTSTDAIASFSSRGPRTGGSIQKPDVSAPGNQVVSAGHSSDTARATMSGTSMACPHVAGLVALLKGRNHALTFEQVRNTIQNTAARNLVSGGQTCNGVPDTQFPNFTFGYGRIDALSAVQAIV